MSKHPAADKFKKKRVVMKNYIPVFEGYAATGGISGVQFSIVCPDRESCDEIWNLLGKTPLNHDGIQQVVICRASDIEMDVTPDTQSI